MISICLPLTINKQGSETSQSQKTTTPVDDETIYTPAPPVPATNLTNLTPKVAANMGLCGTPWKEAQLPLKALLGMRAPDPRLTGSVPTTEERR